MSSPTHLTGYIAIVGRPNVGKSTLLNRLIGQKVSITSRKAQTTRHRIIGIHSESDAQFVFVDTPGFQLKHTNALNRSMNRNVTDTLGEVDAVLFVIEALKYSADDVKVMKLLPEKTPVVLVINKVDRVSDKGLLLPFIEKVAVEFPFRAIVPVSAQQGSQVKDLLTTVRSFLPEGPPMYSEDDVTDRNVRFLAAEFIREKIFRLSGEELPYATSVIVEKFEEEGNLTRIHAAIIVDKPNHKAIVIGKGGEKLKQIGTDARLDLEKLLDTKVYLELFVKVKSGWADDKSMLKQLGYE
ncbi:MAG: GTPase Era [Pseudomonadota bacterium]